MKNDGDYRLNRWVETTILSRNYVNIYFTKHHVVAMICERRRNNSRTETKVTLQFGKLPCNYIRFDI